MRSLRIIQVLAKIARVLFIIGFVGSIIGAVGCIIALPTLSAVANIEVEGKTIAEILKENNLNIETLYLAISVGLFSCIVAIVLCKINSSFLKKEIQEGTPFTAPMVKAMRKNALINVITAVASWIIIGIAIAICKKVLPITDFKYSYSCSTEIGWGFALLVLSLFAEYPLEANLIKPKEDVIDKSDYLE